MDVAIEALGSRPPSRTPAQRAPGRDGLQPGRLFGAPAVPLDAFAAGLGDHTDRDLPVPGREGADAPPHERRAAKRFPFRELVTHPFRLNKIEAAYDLFANQRDGVMKVAITP